LSPESDGKLEIVWVKAFNFPEMATKEDIVMEVAYVVGDPEEVNTFGLVRVKLACREVSRSEGKPRCFLMVKVEGSDGNQSQLKKALMCPILLCLIGREGKTTRMKRRINKTRTAHTMIKLVVKAQTRTFRIWECGKTGSTEL
jgi:hypothetical protein